MHRADDISFQFEIQRLGNPLIQQHPHAASSASKKKLRANCEKMHVDTETTFFKAAEMSIHEPAKFSLSERLTAAILAAVFMGLTVFALSLMFIFMLSMVTFTRVDGSGAAFASDVLSFVLISGRPLFQVFGVVTLAASIGGFVFGTERVVRWFGIIWQTETPTQCELYCFSAVMIGLAGYTLYSVVAQFV